MKKMRDSTFQKMNAVTMFKVCDLKYKIINVLNLKHIIYKNSVYVQICVHFGKIRLIYVLNTL